MTLRALLLPIVLVITSVTASVRSQKADVTGFFSNMYYSSFIATNQRVTVGGILLSVIEGLNPEEQIEVVKGLQKYLVGQGLVNDRINQCWNEAWKK